MEIFKLVKDLENPAFDGFDFAESTISILGNELPDYDFKLKDEYTLCWQTVSLKAKWKPQKVTGRVRPFNDFPCIGITTDVPIFSQRAINALGPFLESSGEILPLISPIGKYYAYNLTARSHALDPTCSRMTFIAGKETAHRIDYYCFSETKVTSAIFRIQEQPKPIYVTDSFRDRALEAGLNGFCFVKVWPLAKELDWELEFNAENRLSRKRSEELSGESVVFTLNSAKTKPSPSEMKLAEDFVGKIEVLLASEKSVDDPYFGTVEYLKSAKHKIEIGISCPNATALTDYIWPLVEELHWKENVSYIVRHGNLFESEVVTEEFSIEDAE